MYTLCSYNVCSSTYTVALYHEASLRSQAVQLFDVTWWPSKEVRKLGYAVVTTAGIMGLVESWLCSQTFQLAMQSASE